MTGTINCELF